MSTTSVILSTSPSTPNGIKFAFGGLSGMTAQMFSQPLDLLKSRMQLSGLNGKKEYRSSFHAFRSIIANEGLFAVYNGLSAGLARQASYTTTRLGVYTWLFEKFSKPGESSSFALKAALGMTAGAIGSFIGNPTDVALIRMTSDGRASTENRRNYKNVFDAIYRIFKEEGVTALWRGCTPTVCRAIVVNSVQLGTYSEAKQIILSSGYVKDGIFCHFLGSMVSGLATTFASLPVDIAKTRIQNMRIINGQAEYKGSIDVLSKVVKNEGFFALWKGFTPYYLRNGPHTVIMFIVLEQLNGMYYKYVYGINRISTL